jgi:hypothetical protein
MTTYEIHSRWTSPRVDLVHSLESYSTVQLRGKLQDDMTHSGNLLYRPNDIIKEHYEETNQLWLDVGEEVGVGEDVS